MRAERYVRFGVRGIHDVIGITEYRAVPGPMEREHALRHRSYSVLAFSSLSRLAAMDSSTELVPLIHAPPSRRRSSGKGP